jgi:hypothetical protein
MKKIVLLLLCASTIITFSCKEPDDGPEPPAEFPKLAISNVTTFEGDENNNYRFKVSTSLAFDQEVSVDYQTEDITAGQGEDYVATSGTLNIPAGAREAYIEVEIIADTLKESDEEFKVTLSNPQKATIFQGEGIGTIRNDDDYVFIPADGYITPDNYTGYDLVWRDEFDGNSLNTSDWNYEIGAGGWGNEERQYYTDRAENSYVSNGRLTIEARDESFSGSPYTSARLTTQNKVSYKYGRVDIRAILPEGQGIWPALWMLGDNISSVGWPACGEIDIMELVGHEANKVHGTAHWGPQGNSWSYNKGGAFTLSSGKYSDEYHVFSIIWEPNSIKWMVDDVQYFSLTNSDVNGAYPFDVDNFFFIFNIAVGGLWPGYPDATTQFPQRMHVDYIRMFQKK